MKNTIKRALQYKDFSKWIQYLAVMLLSLGSWSLSVSEVSAQSTIGSLNVSGVEVRPPAITTRSITLPAGTVDQIDLNISVVHFGPSWGSETRITIRSPSGVSRTFSGFDFGWGTTPGTFSSSSTLSFPSASSAGVWTVEFADSFDDSSVAVDHSYLSGSTISFRNSDTTAPTVAITSTLTDPTNTSPIPMTVTFSESVSGFTSSEIVPGNGTVSNFSGSGTTYTFDLTPAGDGAVTVDVPADVAQDTAGNGNDAAPQFALEFDGTSPELTISGVPATYLPGDIFEIRFSFSEDVTGFDETDVAVTGGILSDFQMVSMSVYTATLAPGDTSDVTLAVSAGAGEDSAGNTTAGASAVSAINSSGVSSEEIAYFMENRAHAILQAQPGLMRFLDGRSGVSFQASANISSMNLNFATGTAGSVWTTLQASHVETATHDLSYALLTLGVHTYRTEDFIIGGMLQIDTADQTSEDGVQTKGTGGLIGPYFVSRLGDQPLYVEGRLLFGRSKNEISPLGTYSDEFTTDRMLARVGVEGEYEAGGVTFLPNLNFSHVSDEQRAYVDGLGNPVPKQSVALTEINLGIDFEAEFPVRDGELMFTGGFSRAWSRTQGTGPAVNYLDIGERWDGRIDLGVQFTGEDGLSISTGTYLTGFNSDSPRRISGAEVTIEYRF